MLSLRIIIAPLVVEAAGGNDFITRLEEYRLACAALMTTSSLFYAL